MIFHAFIHMALRPIRLLAFWPPSRSQFRLLIWDVTLSEI